MLRVTFYTRKGRLCGFRTAGHAGYAEEGADIVCASVSSAVMLTCNGITEIVKAPCSVIEREEDAEIRILLEDGLEEEALQKCELLFKTFRLHIGQLSEQFEYYLKSDVMEV